MAEKSSILLVDDRPENLLVLETLLDEFDLDIVKASSGAEALKLSVREDFALILLDVQMPDLDGFETAEMLRSVEKTRYIPIIFVTAISKDAEHVFKGYESGAVDYLFKPIEPLILKNKVKIFLELYEQKIRLMEQAHKLEQANERLVDMNNQMRKFVGIVAHDLRAPLGKLINLSEVLLSGVEPESLDTFYEMLLKTSRRGFALVNDILDLTAMESGRVQLEIERCDLSGVARSVVTELEYMAEEKGVRLLNKVDIPFDVRADGKRIFQVLGNLLTNAVKFTPRAGTVTLQVIPLDGGARVMVSDTGVGMSKKLIDDLFVKHEKRSSPGTEGEMGTGFGLSLSQELVNAHQSKIEVKSEVDKGSCFSFVLPWWEEPSKEPGS